MNDYFCVLPFFGYEFKSTKGTHCCLLPDSYDINQLRQNILDKKKSNLCSACWKLEDVGLVSDRKLKNSALDFYWNRDLRLIEEDVREGKFFTNMVKYYTSNLCNSTCVTCSSGPSTAWGPVEKKMNIIPVKPTSKTKDDIDQELDFKNLVALNLVGGEPLYEKLNFYILEKLLEHGNKKCFVQVTTNGSTNLSATNKNLIKQFKNLNFNISMDGVGPVFEYLRYPLKWNDLLDNLEFFKSITNNVSASYTTSNVNLYYHHDTINWFKKHNLNYHYNPVIYPSEFQPSALPKSIKEKILKKYPNSKDLNFFIGKEHTKEDDENFEKMLKTISLQDKAKGIKINDYLPEFCELINFL